MNRWKWTFDQALIAVTLLCLGVLLAMLLWDSDCVTIYAPLADSSSGTAPQRLNLNTASFEELLTLPEIGPTLARRILDYRQEHEGFQSVAELQNIAGIGAATYAQLQDYVTAGEP